MDRKRNTVASVVVIVPTTAVILIVRGIIDDHMSWPVALAIALVPGALKWLGGPIPL